MEIRDAIPEDAPSACVVLKRSIAELCAADHKNDPAILARWLGNKTIENVLAWISQPDNSLLIAVEDDDVLAVGSVTDSGTVGLNYVSPDARFRGVSRALLRALEARAFERRNSRCSLTSTETARRFYLSNGYAVNVACLDGVNPFDFPEVPVMDGVNHTNDTGKPTRRAGALRFIPAD